MTAHGRTPALRMLIIGRHDGVGPLLAGVLRGRGHEARLESPEALSPSLTRSPTPDRTVDSTRPTLRHWLKTASGMIAVSAFDPSAPDPSEAALLVTLAALLPAGALCVYASSLAVFGAVGPAVIVDESITPPQVPALLQGVREIESWLLRQRRLRGVVVRLGYVWDIDDRKLSWALRALLHDQTITVSDQARFPSVRLGGVLDLIRRSLKHHARVGCSTEPPAG